jgi:membrane protease YdiL (CAAX protease family)
MRNLLQKLPFPVEFAVVVAGAFGLTIVSSVLTLAHHHTGTAGPAEIGVWRTVGLEAITLGVLGAFLWGRGWTAKRLGLGTHWIDGLWGLALAAGSYVAIFLVFMLLAKLAPGLIPHAGKAAASATPTLTPYAVGALVLVNAFYEEFFVAGYVITALKEKSLPNLAINLSIAIRLAAHLFQGTMSLVLMIPIGLIFGTWYVRSGRLWPLILAHALLNAWSYAAYIKW